MTGVERAILYGAIATLLVLSIWLVRRITMLNRQLDSRPPPTREADPIRYEREDTLADFLHSRRPDADE